MWNSAIGYTLGFVAVTLLLGIVAFSRIVGIVMHGFDKAVLLLLVVEIIFTGVLLMAHAIGRPILQQRMTRRWTQLIRRFGTPAFGDATAASTTGFEGPVRAGWTFSQSCTLASQGCINNINGSF